VLVYVLSRVGNGLPDQPLIDKVVAALNADERRPLTDLVDVQPAAVVPYTIVAELVMYPGPDASTVKGIAQAAAQAYADAMQLIDADVALSGIFKSLHQPGVKQVNLTAPATNLVINGGQASYCTGITLTTRTADDA
jgi:phage-related baseplate assembly protein